MIVAGIARLQISRHVFGINSCEVLLKKRHAEATTSMLVSRAQETEVVVRFGPRVGLIKTVQEFCDLRCPSTDEVIQSARNALFSVVGKLGRQKVGSRQTQSRSHRS